MSDTTIYTGEVVGNPSDRVLNSIPMGRTIERTFTVPLDGTGRPYSEHRWFVITLIYLSSASSSPALDTMTFSFAPDNNVFELDDEERDSFMAEQAWEQKKRVMNMGSDAMLIMGDAHELNFTIVPRHLTPMSVGSNHGSVELRPSDAPTEINKDHPTND